MSLLTARIPIVLHVNGKEIEYDKTMLLSELLIHLEMSKLLCAVEVNKQLIPHNERGHFVLNDDDHIEIVTLVGGG